MSRIDVRGKTECWPWRGTLTSTGYGVLQPNGSTRKLRAHRLVYELFVGPIPDGYDIDHVCHNRDDSCDGGDNCPHRRCCNPTHLEPATRGENVRRGVRVRRSAKACIHGHPRIPANVWVRPDGRMDCAVCARAKNNARYHANKGEVLVNNADKTHCDHGHPFDEENTAFNKRGQRRCRECSRTRSREYKRLVRARRQESTQ